MPPFRSITTASHAYLAARLRPGDRTIDATAGQGGDTLVLAERVGPTGCVWALDRQPAALAATRQRLAAAGLLDRCTLMLGEHRTIERAFPPDAQAGIAAVVFNLGYLPGGDHAITTTAESTCHALWQVWGWLRPGGALAVVCYPGHPEGARESAAVRTWFERQARQAGSRFDEISTGPTRRPAPFLLTLERPQ